MIQNIVTVAAAPPRLEVGGRVDVRNAECREIAHDGTRVAKGERAIKLQPVCRARYTPARAGGRFRLVLGSRGGSARHRQGVFALGRYNRAHGSLHDSRPNMRNSNALRNVAPCPRSPGGVRAASRSDPSAFTVDAVRE